MTNQDNTGSRFFVDLGNIKLPLAKEQQVNAEIQATVLRALAETDFGGEAQEAQRRQRLPDWAQFMNRTWGLWPFGEPPTFFPSGDSGPLTVQDHTLIMKAVMDHPLHVLRYLPEKVKTKGGRPSGTEVLQAVLQVAQIGDDVKQRVRAVLALLPKLEEAQAAAPESLKHIADDLRQKLANKTIEQKRSVLRDESLRSKYGAGVANGMEIAAQMLEDGQDSIYSSRNGFYQLLQGERGSTTVAEQDPIGDISNADFIAGSIAGAVGAFFGGLGAVPGAATAATLASAVAAIGELLAWILG